MTSAIDSSRVKVLLVDNGSLEPAATLQLRGIAAALSERVGRPVAPVSLLHSDKIPAERLAGAPAATVEGWLRREAAAGTTECLLLPLFIGPSRALTEFLPARIAALRLEHPALQVHVAAPLYRAGDDRLAAMLADRVQAESTADFARGAPVRVALVDHGSPEPAVTAVRDALATELAALLGAGVAAVAPCSMERRPGPAYAFNEPLLETLLARPAWSSGPVIVAQLFLTPGRHAGPDGDVAAICARAMSAGNDLRIARTEVLGRHPLLLNILADRLAAAM